MAQPPSTLPPPSPPETPLFLGDVIREVGFSIFSLARLVSFFLALSSVSTWNRPSTSLDEGDVVRLLRRTVDLLAQLPYCPAVSEELRSNGRRALQMINRFPVKEAVVEGVVDDSLNPATMRAASE